jgi:hypothetical protein
VKAVQEQMEAAASPRRHPGYPANDELLLVDIAMHHECADVARAASHYQRLISLAEPRGLRPLVAHGHLGLAVCRQRTDRGLEAKDHLAIASAMYREMGMASALETAEAVRS